MDPVTQLWCITIYNQTLNAYVQFETSCTQQNADFWDSARSFIDAIVARYGETMVREGLVTFVDAQIVAPEYAI